MSSEVSTLRIALCEAAVERWLVQKRFSLADLADSQGIALGRLLELFEGRDALLRGYYDTRWIAFHTLRAQVPGYDGYTFEEKLSNLLYSLIDLMRPQKTFVCRTWPRYIGSLPHPAGLSASDGLMRFMEELLKRGTGVLNRGIGGRPGIPGGLRGLKQLSDACRGLPAGASFRSAFQKELATLLTSDDVSRSSRALMRLTPAMDLIWLAFLGIVDYWCRDSSHDGEKTMALIDKWVALIGAVAASEIADKGLDLARFASGDLMKRMQNQRASCRCNGGCGCGGGSVCRCEGGCGCCGGSGCRCEGGCGCCGGSAQTRVDEA